MVSSDVAAADSSLRPSQGQQRLRQGLQPLDRSFSRTAALLRSGTTSSQSTSSSDAAARWIRDLRGSGFGSIRLPSVSASRNRTWSRTRALSSCCVTLGKCLPLVDWRPHRIPNKRYSVLGAAASPAGLPRLRATANIAICTHRGSSSSPKRLSRRTASCASGARSPSSSARICQSIEKASTRKWPDPQHGSITVTSAIRSGQPSKAPAAGRPSSSNRRYSKPFDSGLSG